MLLLLLPLCWCCCCCYCQQLDWPARLQLSRTLTWLKQLRYLAPRAIHAMQRLITLVTLKWLPLTLFPASPPPPLCLDLLLPWRRINHSGSIACPIGSRCGINRQLGLACLMNAPDNGGKHGWRGSGRCSQCRWAGINYAKLKQN